MISRHAAEIIRPGNFVKHNHFYPGVLNSTAHPTVQRFLQLSRDTIISLYCSRHPQIDSKDIASLLQYKCKYFLWSGSDLLYVRSAENGNQMVVIETNSCPSGQKHMPGLEHYSSFRGYERLIKTVCSKGTMTNKSGGGLAVLYDKNKMEASGYAAALAELSSQNVMLVPFFENDLDPPVRFSNSILEVRDAYGWWHSIEFALRYVTQRPWNRIPFQTKTHIVNPTVVCLAGGRNKLMACKAYEEFNTSLTGTGLRIKTPRTICNVRKSDVPRLITELGGKAVVKVPYSNAGQGIYIITNERELFVFMNENSSYEEYIIQSLIGSEPQENGQIESYSHIGTKTSGSEDRYVFDMRMMVTNNDEGFHPVALYSRRAKSPLNSIKSCTSYWDVFGTNLSYKGADGEWQSDESRLISLCRSGFESLELGLEELVEAYIQTVMSVIAIDQMAERLMNKNQGFDYDHFSSLNGDRQLLQEMSMSAGT